MRRLPRLNEQRLGLSQNNRLLILALGQRLQPPLNPRLPPLDLDRLRDKHHNLIRHARRLVGDVQTRRDADLVRQRGEAAARQPLVEQRAQQPAVYDARVAAQRGAEVLDGDEGAAVGGAELQRRHGDLVPAEERPAREVLPAQLLGDLEVRARGDVFLVVEEGLCEGVLEDALLDSRNLGGRGREEGEGFLVAGRAGEGPHGLDCRGAGHDEASCEGSEGERDRDGETDVERPTRCCRRRRWCRDLCVCLRLSCYYEWLAKCKCFTLPQRPHSRNKKSLDQLGSNSSRTQTHQQYS